MTDDEETGAGPDERAGDLGEGDESAAERDDSDANEAVASPVPTVKSSLLWGVIGGLSFLVLIQGYELVTDRGVTLVVKFGVAALVGGIAGGSTYAVRGRLPAENESA